MNVNQIMEVLIESADINYKQFNERIVAAGSCPTIGVRMPVMRQVAQAVARSGQVDEFWKEYPWDYYEHIMIRGMVIGYCKRLSFEQTLAYMRQWLEYACSWAHIDCVTTGLKIGVEEREKFWDFATSYLNDDGEYKARFGVIALMNFFIDEEHIDKVLDIYASIQSDKYYVQMGVAWALSVCFVKFRDKTLTVLESDAVNPKIQNLTIRKIVDSFRITDNDKILIRTLKRK